MSLKENNTPFLWRRPGREWRIFDEFRLQYYTKTTIAR